VIHGCDVSAFQGAPDHWSPEAGAISFAGVKATELGVTGSRYISPDLAADAAYLKAKGLGRIFYTFGHPHTLPSATVALLAEAVHPFLEDGDGLALDLEVNDGLSPAEVASWARLTTAAMREVFGRPAIIYSDLGFFQAGNAAGCSECPLWIADISRPAGQPRIPAPWKTYLLHQFSWVPLDRDVANVSSLAELRAAVGKAAPPKPRLAPEDTAMLLTRGAGAITPFPVPEPATKVRLYAAEGTAEVRWNLAGEPVHDLKLSQASSEVITLPAGKHAVRFVRVDGGGNDVAAVAEA
jgi:lysozyme